MSDKRCDRCFYWLVTVVSIGSPNQGRCHRPGYVGDGMLVSADNSCGAFLHHGKMRIMQGPGGEE